MPNQRQDYTAIQDKLELGLRRRKRLYRTLFFVMHLVFFAVSMLVVWGTLMGSAVLQDTLFNGGTGAALVVVVPTILWAFVLLFHVAALFFETSRGEIAIRRQLAAREISEDMLRGETQEKLKRRDPLESEHMRLTSDGELIPLDDEQPEPRRYTHSGEAP
jgi:hypothetical protein